MKGSVSWFVPLDVSGLSRLIVATPRRARHRGPALIRPPLTPAPWPGPRSPLGSGSTPRLGPVERCLDRTEEPRRREPRPQPKGAPNRPQHVGARPAYGAEAQPEHAVIFPGPTLMSPMVPATRIVACTARRTCFPFALRVAVEVIGPGATRSTLPGSRATLPRSTHRRDARAPALAALVRSIAAAISERRRPDSRTRRAPRRSPAARARAPSWCARRRSRASPSPGPRRRGRRDGC